MDFHTIAVITVASGTVMRLNCFPREPLSGPELPGLRAPCRSHGSRESPVRSASGSSAHLCVVLWAAAEPAVSNGSGASFLEDS